MSTTDTMNDADHASDTQGPDAAGPAPSQLHHDPLTDTLADPLADGGEGDSVQFFVGGLPHLPPAPRRH